MTSTIDIDKSMDKIEEVRKKLNDAGLTIDDVHQTIESLKGMLDGQDNKLLKKYIEKIDEASTKLMNVNEEIKYLPLILSLYKIKHLIDGNVDGIVSKETINKRNMFVIDIDAQFIPNDVLNDAYDILSHEMPFKDHGICKDYVEEGYTRILYYIEI